MTKLTAEFKRWYKGGKVVKVAQGDDNLIVALINAFTSDIVGVWQRTNTDYQPEKFRLLKQESFFSRGKAIERFNKIKEEF